MVTTINEYITTSLTTTSIPEVLEQIGFQPQPLYQSTLSEEDADLVKGIDEDFLYEMGYTLGELPGNILNNTHEFCNAILAKMSHSTGNISFQNIQHQADIYLAGYQAGLRAK